MEGIFRGWNGDFPYGFIAPDDGAPPIFMHLSELLTPLPLRAGTRVEFDIEVRERGPAARRVKASARTNRIRGQVTRWLDDRGFGFIKVEGEADDAFAHARNLISRADYLSVGDIVEFAPLIVEKGIEAIEIDVVGWKTPSDKVRGFIDPELRLARLADMGGPRWIHELASLAESEPWEYSHATASTPLPILRSYFMYTFRRLEEMPDGLRKSASGGTLSFNTGLVTVNQEEIFAFFRAHHNKERQPWVFEGFKRASDRQFVDNFGSDVPPLAFYFEDPSVLLYDRRCELFIDIDHVLENLERFPVELQSNLFMARNLLMSAEATTKKRVYRNYKAAIPQYYRDKGGQGSMQLLLPICLLNPSKADLALAVSKNEAGNAYRGSTVLTLDMAYNNARLLARPDTEWLKP